MIGDETVQLAPLPRPGACVLGAAVSQRDPEPGCLECRTCGALVSACQLAGLEPGVCPDRVR